MGGLSNKVLALGILALAVSCKGPEKSDVARETDTAPPPPAAPKVEPLPKGVTDRIPNSCGVVRLADGTLRQGVVISTGRSSNGKSDFAILADVPADEQRVDFAIGSPQTEFFSAVRKMQLANGLSLFGFSTNLRLDSFNRHVSILGNTVHAIRLAPGEALPAAQLEALRVEIGQKTVEMNQGIRLEAERMRSNPSSARRTQLSPMAAIAYQIDCLKSRLSFAAPSISPVETAAGTSPKELGGSKADCENTVLVGEDLKVFAMRHKGKWVKIDEALDSIPDRPKGVSLSLTGYNSSLQLECSLEWEIPPLSTSFSLVAATTHELELQGGGSLEDRLAKVTPVLLQASGAGRSISKNLSWAGTPTTLWIKVIDDANPGAALIDEAVSLAFDGALVAKWDKPPSELIEIPGSGPDSPEDLVKERTVIDAGGTVLDMIPGEDSSVLFVQTDKPPFWASLDLKTGVLGKVPWTATADTLVAIQAGKTYLAKRKTKEIEIWDNASAKRESIKLLNMPGELVAFAAPRQAAGSPVLVATTEAAGFVDPATFKAVDCVIDLSPVYPKETKANPMLTKLDPATLSARASADGTIYALTGMGVGARGETLKSISMIMADGSVIQTQSNGNLKFLTAAGRNVSREIPDQAGGDLALAVVRKNTPFPGPQGSIAFRSGKGSGMIATLETAPFLPSVGTAVDATGTAFDRRLYLDSTLGVLLIPEEGKIHFLRLNLPEIPVLGPDFVFSGETLQIPLPVGTGHRASSAAGGEFIVSGDVLSWKVPDKVQRSNATLQLDWTGELGSAMTREIGFNLLQSPDKPTVLSPDGQKSIELRRRATLPANLDFKGIAGAGNVILFERNYKLSAWSLVDGSKISEIDSKSRITIGDADRIYTFDDKGELSSYDIKTGNKLQSHQYGNKSQGSKQGISAIATGNASRGALYTIAFDGFKSYFAQIERDTLAMHLIDFGSGPAPEPTSRLNCNPSGSACWSWTWGLFREGNRFTGKRADGAIEGYPDASGRFISNHDQLLDIGQDPQKSVFAKDFPGAGNIPGMLSDHSGRYFLFSNYDQETDSSEISVRRFPDVTKELFRIKFAKRVSMGEFMMISGTNTLLTPGSYNGGYAVYDLDCEAMAAAAGNP